jgi:hypothetical protein
VNNSHDVPGMTDAVRDQAPWIITGLLGIWAWVLRLLVGRAIRSSDQVAADIVDIKERLARIEGKLEGRK